MQIRDKTQKITSTTAPES